MSKYKSKTYAQALVDSLSSKVDDKKIVANFLKLLQKNQDLRKAREIITLAEELLLKKTGNKKIILETARNINSKVLVKNIVKKGDMVQEKINPDIVAGVKITINGNRQLDFSLLKKLENIF